MPVTLPTYGQRGQFQYEGSVGTGTRILYGRRGSYVSVSRSQYRALLKHFKDCTVAVGISYDRAPQDSLGSYLKQRVTRTAIAPYVGAILVHEGYAERVPGQASTIRFRSGGWGEELRVCYNDIVLLVFTRVLRIDNWWKMAIFSLSYASLIWFVIPAWNGHLLATAEVLGSLEDWPGLVSAGLVVPFVMGFYLWQIPAFSTAVAELRSREVLRVTGDEYVRWQEKQRQRLSFLGWHVASWVLVLVLGWLYGTAVMKGPPMWLTVHPFTWWGIRVPMNIIQSYMICMVAVRQVIIIWSLFDLFGRAQVRLLVSHPDGCGGFSPLGDYSVRCSYFLAVCLLGLALMTFVVQDRGIPFLQSGFVVTWIGYVAFSPVSFVLPLYAAHREMRKAKHESQLKVSRRLTEAYRSIEGGRWSATSVEAPLARRSTRVLNELRSLESLTQSFPEWPVNAPNVSRFVLTIVVPLTPYITIGLGRLILGL